MAQFLALHLGIWIYCKITKIKMGYIFDLMAPGIIMAQAIGRVGCLFNGCCYGTPTTLPWGLVYTDPQSFGFTGGIPCQPTVAYEIIFCIIIFRGAIDAEKKVEAGRLAFRALSGALCGLAAWHRFFARSAIHFSLVCTRHN